MFHSKSSRHLLCSALVLCLIAAAGTALAFLPLDDEDGYWAPSGHSDCPGNMICADWFSGHGQPSPYSCCLDSSNMTSNSIAVCQIGFRHGPHY